MKYDVWLGAVYDAMRLLGLKDEEFYLPIYPQVGYKNIIHGPAFTTFGRVVDKKEDYSSLDEVRLEFYKPEFFKDKPIVVLQANDSKVAHSGDITSLIYKTLGSVGFVTDGIVRDLDLIDSYEYPVFCKGANPIDALDYWALTEYQVPVILHQVQICPGDYLYASRDGVINVPNSLLQRFQEYLVQIITKENNVRKSLIESADIHKTLNDSLIKFGRW